MAIGDELSSIDFESMIGGPLNAVVRAQAQSAQTIPASAYQRYLLSHLLINMIPEID